jgi:hypothetical protein
MGINLFHKASLITLKVFPQMVELDDIRVSPVYIPFLWREKYFPVRMEIDHELKGLWAWKKSSPSQDLIIRMTPGDHKT